MWHLHWCHMHRQQLFPVVNHFTFEGQCILMRMGIWLMNFMKKFCQNEKEGKEKWRKSWKTWNLKVRWNIKFQGYMSTSPSFCFQISFLIFNWLCIIQRIIQSNICSYVYVIKHPNHSAFAQFLTTKISLRKVHVCYI